MNRIIITCLVIELGFFCISNNVLCDNSDNTQHNVTEDIIADKAFQSYYEETEYVHQFRDRLKDILINTKDVYCKNLLDVQGIFQKQVFIYMYQVILSFEG